MLSQSAFTSCNSSLETPSDALDLSTKPTILGICTDSSRCGCAIYSDFTIQMIADKRDTADPYKGLDIIIQRIGPKIVIISAVQQRLFVFLEKRFRFNLLDLSKRGQVRKDFEESLANFMLVIVPNIWFKMSNGIKLLVESELVRNQGLRDEEEKLLFIASRVERSQDVCAIRSISAIAEYLLHARPSQFEPETGLRHSVSSQTESLSNKKNESIDLQTNPMPILDLKYTDPGPVLSIDKFSLDSLSILGLNRIQKVETSEEDQSDEALPYLYDVLNQCQSSQGKRNLRTMMMWPLQDIIELRNRYDVVDYFVKSENRLLRDQMMMQLKNVVPLSVLLTKLSQSVGTYKELSILYKCLWSFIAIIDLVKANGDHGLEIFHRISNLDCGKLRTAVDSIINIVDFEASKKDKRIQVCLGVDENVDEKKEIINNLTAYCDRVGNEETERYRGSIGKQFEVLYIPRIGFLSRVNYSTISELVRIRSNNEFDVLFHTEISVYFKTPRMESLDINAGDVACDLIDVQESVIIALQNELLKCNETILRLMEQCGELDCLIGFAIVSYQRGYTRPQLVEGGGEIDILQACHPLHSIKQETVANDIRFYDSRLERRVKVMLLTGPNSCGKTTYMKTTLLVIYMAHIGCFVPAHRARLPIVDAILTRMHSANSISTGLSSFATDLHQVNYALNRATKKSIIAIDEFGKGTQARDGIHLLKGLMVYFATRALESPFVIAATHYNRLMGYLMNYSEFILYKTFKVSKDPTRDDVIYEFKLVNGIGEVSLADQVATRAGVSKIIIDRAKQTREHLIEGTPIRPRAASGA